ncbi:hypothetical protein PRIPAC_96352, partial [Pristionchus pacificus]
TPLHNAILLGNMLYDVDQENDKGHTALHLAMEQHGTEAASILLANGASPDVTDFHGATPAHIASAAGNIDAFDMLMYYKADVCAIDNAGRSPLDCAAEQGRLMASFMHLFTMVEKILESGLPIGILRQSSESHSASALHLAARMGHVQSSEEKERLPRKLLMDISVHELRVHNHIRWSLFFSDTDGTYKESLRKERLFTRQPLMGELKLHDFSCMSV